MTAGNGSAVLDRSLELETYDPVSNGGEVSIMAGAPYTLEVELEGTSALLFHAWNNEAVAEKASAAKGSAAKKTDDLNSYVYRTDPDDPNSDIGIPSEYLRMSLVNAARYIQDPRSPRKSGMDLFKAGITVGPEISSLGTNDWDYIDARRVTIQRAGITRQRPAFKAGWRCTFQITVLLPEYISKLLLLDVLGKSGRFVGLGDFRPTFGRFNIARYEVVATS